LSKFRSETRREKKQGGKKQGGKKTRREKNKAGKKTRREKNKAGTLLEVKQGGNVTSKVIYSRGYSAGLSGKACHVIEEAFGEN